MTTKLLNLTHTSCAKCYPTGAKLVKLITTCGSLDIDDPQPAVTVMMSDED